MHTAVDQQPILSLQNVTFRIRDRKLAPGTDWALLPGQHWAVLGPNGSGKSTFVRTLAGVLPTAAGRRIVGEGRRISLVSFEEQQRLLARELARDGARTYSGALNAHLTVRDVLLRRPGPPVGVAATDEKPPVDVAGTELPHSINPILEQFGLKHLIDRPFRAISAGEMRKTMIVRALVDKPSVLILDEPFDGLDVGSRASLANVLSQVMSRGVHLVLVTHRLKELPARITHVVRMDGGAIVEICEITEIRDSANAGGAPDAATVTAEAPTGDTRPRDRRYRPREGTTEDSPPVIELKNVTVKYGETVVLNDFNWTVRQGEVWALSGPNGSGKTTILNLIAGDNLQSYANNVRIFGRRRGPKMSLWDIKRRVGMVDPYLHLTYQPETVAFEVVLSGFFDSIGVYRRATDAQKERTEELLKRFGLGQLRNRPFGQLSYGQKRLLLIARAVIKRPALLLLDEPCQGLDASYRRSVLDMIEDICRIESPTVVYVTHHRDEVPRCVTDRLVLPSPSTDAVQSVIYGMESKSHFG